MQIVPLHLKYFRLTWLIFRSCTLPVLLQADVVARRAKLVGPVSQRRGHRVNSSALIKQRLFIATTGAKRQPKRVSWEGDGGDVPCLSRVQQRKLPSSGCKAIKSCSGTSDQRKDGRMDGRRNSSTTLEGVLEYVCKRIGIFSAWRMEEVNFNSEEYSNKIGLDSFSWKIKFPLFSLKIPLRCFGKTTKDSGVKYLEHFIFLPEEK